MPKVRKKGKAGDSKEIEKLKKRREKASEKGDYAEESKLCNAIGESYFQNGEFKLALRYHQDELALSEAVADPLSMGIACRKVGECLCEMGSYEEAVKYQKKHLELSRRLRDLKEEQRALATLGRTFYVYSQSALEGESSDLMKSLLLRARNYYEQALEACNKLTGELSDGGIPPRELLEMRSRLYLNLGLVFEDQGDLKNAREHILKALHIVKELGDSATVYRCHNGLGLLYQREKKHIAKAEESFQEALKVAKQLGDKHKEADTLKDIAQVCMDQFDFERAKICLKEVVKLLRSLHSSQEDLKQEEDRLKNVRRILYYSLEAEKKSLEDAHDKAALYDKLGDLCCELKAFPAALKFYGNQLSVAEKCEFGCKKMSAVYVSLAMTHTDCGQFSQALLYYDRELKLWSGAPSQECSSWSSIALVREKAGQGVEQVMEAYSKAAGFAEKAQQPKKMMRVYKSAISYLKARPSFSPSSGSSHSSDFTPPVSPSCRWHQKLSHLLESHPYLADEPSSEEEEEGPRYVTTPPDEAFLMSSSEEEEGESDGEIEVAAARGVASRPKRDLAKAKLNKKVNDKGETSLHVAAIGGKLSRVKALIQKGAEVNRTDNAGWTPLHEASNFGYTDIARALLEAGATVDPVSGLEGTTPLMDAAWNGHPELVTLLVEEGGADLTRKNFNGHTALAVVNKALSEETEESYRDYHEPRCIIRDYLAQQMRRRGLSVRETTPLENSTNSIKFDELGRDVRGQSTVSKGHGIKRGALKRQRTDDRWSSIVSSEEEDSDEGSSFSGRHQRPSVDRDNLLGDLTTRPAFTAPRGSSQSRSGTPPISSGNSCRRFFNPLGQVKPSGPALIPEESVSLIDEASGCPIIDNWLVDDLGTSPPPKRQRQRDSSVERESRALLGLSSSSGGGGGRGKSGSRGRPKASNTRTRPDNKESPAPKSSIIGASPSRRGIVSERSLSSGSGSRIEWRVGGAKGREVGGARSGNRGRDVVGSAAKRSTAMIVSSGSDSEPEQDFQVWKAQNSHQSRTMGSSSSRGSHTQCVSRDHYHHPSTPPHPPPSLLNMSCDRHMSPRHPCTPPHPSPSIHDNHVTIPRPSSPPQPPIRVKVRIEHSSYLIPCPLKTADRVPTTISWLADRASDRYFAQRGRRPLLELTMVDGASLCASDHVGHVLKMDEEVLGVVKKWVCPPLAERYRVACRNLEVDCNSKVLEIFEASNQATSLHLRQCDLQPGDCAPLFQALQSQPKLSVLSLVENRCLKDRGMVYLVQALSGLNGLTVLDLSSTGITHQGLEVLAGETPTSSNDLNCCWQNLQTLNLSSNKVGTADGCGLSSLLRQCRGLRELNMDSCGITSDTLRAEVGITAAIKRMSSLSVLSIKSNSLGGVGLSLLLQALGDLKVNSLNISRTVSTKGAGASVGLGAVLKSKDTIDFFCWGGGQYLENLDVSYCCHGDGEALSLLLDCLNQCSQLRELKMAGWRLSDQHIEPICSFLSLSDSLCSLDLSGNIYLGNNEVLRLLKACRSRLCQDGPGFTLSLQSCGMESPLPENFVKLVQLLRSGDGTGHVPFKLDLYGNMIDQGDSHLIS